MATNRIPPNHGGRNSGRRRTRGETRPETGDGREKRLERGSQTPSLRRKCSDPRPPNQGRTRGSSAPPWARTRKVMHMALYVIRRKRRNNSHVSKQAGHFPGGGCAPGLRSCRDLKKRSWGSAGTDVGAGDSSSERRRTSPWRPARMRRAETLSGWMSWVATRSGRGQNKERRADQEGPCTPATVSRPRIRVSLPLSSSCRQPNPVSATRASPPSSASCAIRGPFVPSAARLAGCRTMPFRLVVSLHQPTDREQGGKSVASRPTAGKPRCRRLLPLRAPR